MTFAIAVPAFARTQDACKSAVKKEVRKLQRQVEMTHAGYIFHGIDEIWQEDETTYTVTYLNNKCHGAYQFVVIKSEDEKSCKIDVTEEMPGECE